jgi:hypothetical protein
MKKILLLLFAIMLTTVASASSYTSNAGYFTASDPSDCTPATVTFTSISSPVGTFSKKINFADGGGYVAWPGLTTNYTYSIAGEYDVWVEYFNSGGSYIGSDWVRIEVYGQPGSVVNVYGASAACPGDQVRFEVSQGFNPSPDYTYSWDFGDGSPLEVGGSNDVQHIYPTTGTYNITVTTTGGGCGGGPYTSTGSFTISTGIPLPTSLSYSVSIGESQVCPNQDFYYQFPEEFASVYVNWGDGTYSTSEHTHSYSTLGMHYPSVTITNGCGDSQTYYDSVEVVNYLHWSPSMFYDINYDHTICPGSTVHFSTWIGATSLEWHLQDGTLISTLNYFEHDYSASDSTYLIATNGCGFDTTIYAPVQIVSTIPIYPYDFNPYVTDSACTGALFSFTSDDNDPKDYIDYRWDFGDGSPIMYSFGGTHAYASNGTYTVTLTATNTCGQDSVATFTVYSGPGVGPDPASIQYFVPEHAKVCPNDSALFVGLYYVSDGLFNIDFGDGNSSNTPTPLNIFSQNYFYFTHAYSTVGTYNTVLTYTNGCGISITKNLAVSVGSGYAVEGNAFYDEAASICLGDPINFHGFGGNQFIWDFGDGSGTLITNTVMDNVPHVYAHPGAYTVTIQITNGCNNTDAENINIIIPDNHINITTNTIDATCHTADGKAIAVITGGNPPYNVEWSNGSNLILVDSLASGIYVCNVTDQIGCYNFGIATVSDAEAPAIVINNVIDVTCHGGHNGVIDINVIGSSGPYTYHWSNGSNAEDQAGLYAGPYEIYVTDAYGCVSTASIQVSEPDEVQVSFFVTDASCGGHDGTITATANGSTGPFTYVWTSGEVGPDLSHLGLGIYEVNVIDSEGCVVTESTTVDEDNGSGGPAIALNDISDLDCGGTGSTIDISVYAATGTITYSWNTGATTEDITVTNQGSYTVTVTDGMGCKAIEVFDVNHAEPATVPICMVSVDSMYAANKVIWEKPVSTTINSFKIYRESSQAGLYYHVGTVPYDSLSVFTDIVANPQIQSWRYKISTVDDCGAESPLSDQHKTIHLNQNLGLAAGSVNLIWDDYEGIGYTTFNIVKYTASGGYVTMSSISSLNHSYTDPAAPLSDSTLFYIITIDLASPCVSTRAQNNNTIRSNRTDNALVVPGNINSVESLVNLSYSHVYPNPANSSVTIEFEVNQTGNYNIQLVDALGNVVYTEGCGKVDLFYKKNIDISQLERGVYFVNILSKDGHMSKRLIKL